MTENSTVSWSGRSGKLYKFWVYELPVSFNGGQPGNYIYSKISSGKWTPLYIGQGELSDRADIEKHHQSSCLKYKGVTHIHVHKNGLEADRVAEESDLLLNFTQAYQPTGCNEKKGG